MNLTDFFEYTILVSKNTYLHNEKKKKTILYIYGWHV